MKNYQIGIAMIVLIVAIAIIGVTTHQTWLGILLAAAVVVLGAAGIARSYRRRNR